MEDMLRGGRWVLRAEAAQPPEGTAGHVSLFSIRYRSDDCEVEGFAAFPGEGEGPWPGLIFNRGGNREFGALRPGTICPYAQRGYAVFASQYRGNCGGTGREEFGGRDVNDVIRLIDIALEMPCVRPEGVYMVGHSRGGMMTYLACARDSRIRAAAICAGLADAFIMYDRFHDGEYDMRQDCQELIGGAPYEMPEAYQRRSAVCWADRIIPPVLILQGTDDWRVIPGQAYEMDRALTAAGKEHKLIVYPGADHSLKGTSRMEDIMSWFAKYPLAAP